MAGEMVDPVAWFLTIFKPSFLYEQGVAAAEWCLKSVTPALVAIAVMVRLVEMKLEMFSTGRSRIGAFLVAVTGWMTLLTLYFVVMSVLCDVFNALYSTFSEQGSLKHVTQTYNRILNDIEQRYQNTGIAGRVADLVVSPVSAPLNIAGSVLFYFSLGLLGLINAIVQLLHALGMNLALFWGLIAIPMSITTTFKNVKAWMTFLFTILAWPLVHYIFMHYAVDYLAAGAEEFSRSRGILDAIQVLDKSKFYLIYTMFNCIVIFLVVTPPFVAYAMVTRGDIGGMVSPFASSIGSAISTVLSGTKMAQSLFGGVSPGTKLKSGLSSSLLLRGGNQSPARPGGSSSPGSGTGPSPSTNQRTPAQRQARRGFFVNRQRTQNQNANQTP